MFTLAVKSKFSAAHALRDYDGDCANLHGHNWTIEMVVGSDSVSETGLAADFRDLKAVLQDILTELDHTNLNNVPPFDKLSPSSENIARWLFEKLSRPVEELGVLLKGIRVSENDECSVTYDGRT